MMEKQIDTQQHSRISIRVATTALFIAQGIVFASWASRLPDIRDHFNVKDLMDFGILLFLIPVGKFFAIPLVGSLLPKVGSKKTVLVSILGFVFSLFVIGFIANNIYVLGVVMFFFGIFWNMTDISLNTQAIEVERIYGSPIIATFHASWSLAACVGALVGYGMINMGIEPRMHFVWITLLAVVVILISFKYLPEVKSFVAEKASEPKTETLWAMIKNLKAPEALLIQLGLIWLLALIVENTMFEWSDIYFQKVIDAPKTMQVGFLVFMVMMFVGRMITSFLYSIWKKETVLKVAGLLIFLGFTISSLFIEMSDDLVLKVAINSAGFMLIGLGISCVVPTLYSIVAERSTTPPGLALTIMSTLSFAGPLIAPLMVGAISHKFSLEWAYLTVGIVGLCIVGLTIFGKKR